MKKIIFIILALLTATLFLSLGGCGLIGSRIARLTTDFRILPSDNRVLYETGAEALAEEASRYLSDALDAVESRQYGKFKEPVVIYVLRRLKVFQIFQGCLKKPEEHL